METIHTQGENRFPFFKTVRDVPLGWFKTFVLNLKFVREAMREAEIKAFPKAHKDILDTMQDDLDKQAEELSKKKLNDLLSPVDLRMIVTMDKQRGIIFIGGEKVEDGRLANLKSEAEFLIKTDLWQLLYETPKELASRAMFVTGETIADMQKGKSILYTLSTQNNIVQTFKGYIGKAESITNKSKL